MDSIEVSSTENKIDDIANMFTAGSWKFTEEVVEVFDKHVRASVPFYDLIQDLISVLSDWLVPQDGIVADLGASTGTTVERIMSRHPSRNISAFLYDDQPKMLGKAAERLSTLVANDKIKLICRNIKEPFDHSNADLTISILTLQFIPVWSRVEVLSNMLRSSRKSGALVVAEKILPAESRWAEIGSELSADYKEAMGIPAESIRSKAKALRGVMIPSTMDALLSMIIESGWKHHEVLFRWNQWVVVGAFAS